MNANRGAALWGPGGSCVCTRPLVYFAAMATATAPRRRSHLRGRRKAGRISLEQVVASARARERAAFDARLRALRKRITAETGGNWRSEDVIREMRDTV